MAIWRNKEIAKNCLSFEKIQNFNFCNLLFKEQGRDEYKIKKLNSFK